MTETKPQNELVIVAEKSGIEISKAQSYAMKFAPYMQKVTEVSEQAKVINYAEPSDKDAQLARELRLQLVKNRTASDGVKEENKRSILTEGRLIDSLYNVVKHASELTEGELMKVEKHREMQVAKEKAELKFKRHQMLIDYCDNPEMFPLGDMTQEAFDNLLTGQKLAHEAKLEAARKAEEERIEKERVAEIARLEHEAEQQRIREENDRLKKEAEEKEAARKAERETAEKALAAERAKVEAEKKAAEAKAKKEREELEKALEEKRKAEIAAQEKLRAEVQAKLAKEKEEREAAEKELREKKEAEQRAIEEANAIIEKELAKGDSEKFADLLNDLEALKGKYEFKSAKYKKLKSALIEMLQKCILYLNQQNSK